VDIQPIAIQISKLRFFISLIVDQKITGTKDDNYGILPLPNLETKFVAANTLIGVQKEIQGVLADLEIEKTQSALLRVRHNHFSAKTAREKWDLRRKDRELSQKLADILKNDGFYTADDAMRMAAWDPYNQNVSSAFFDCYWMFGVKDGFDVVIGNPPYIQIKKGIVSKTQFSYSEGKDKGKQNLYKVFVEAAYNLAKETAAIGCLIVQSSLLCDLSSTYTRELLLTKTKILKILEFPKKAATREGQVFESVLQGTCICIFSKQADSQNVFSISVGNDVIAIHKPVFEKIQQNKILAYSMYAIPLVKQNEFQLYERIVKNSESLLSFAQSVSQGDLNLTTNKKTFSEKKTPIKLYRGKNIQFYFLIEDVDEYLIPSHFDQAISNNQKNDFLVCQEVTGTVDPRRLIFTLVSKRNEKFVFGHTVQKIILKNQKQSKLMLALLNSHLMDWFFRKTSTNNHVASYEIEQLPMPKEFDQTIVAKIERLVDQILAAKAKDAKADTTALEAELDKMVYRVYDLTEDEVKAVEGKKCLNISMI
jgi:hypothetical protein